MQVQIRHVPFNLDTVNQEPLVYLENDHPGPVIDKPDQFWVLNNATGGEYYSVGKFEDGVVPSSINGIPTNVQERGGRWTYHGPGQVSFVMLINIRRLVRLENHAEGLRSVVLIIKDYIEQDFNTQLVYDDEDLGLYLPDGSKVVSYDVDAPAFGWYAIKLSINLNVDVAKFQPIPTCGVENRVMGNLLPGQTITAEQTSVIGENIARAIIDGLYQGQAEVTVEQ